MHLPISLCFALALIKSAVATYTVEFRLGAFHLPASDAFGGLPDTWCFVSIRDGTQAAVLGHTGVELDTDKPVWQEKFSVAYNLYEDKELKFEVWDSDTGSADDYLGLASVLVASLVSDKTSSETWKNRQLALRGGEEGERGEIEIRFKVSGSSRKENCGPDSNGTCTGAGGHIHSGALPYYVLVVVVPFLYTLRI